MSHDIVIRGGQIVDDTGEAPTRGDVAIRGGQIVEVGKVETTLGMARRASSMGN